MARLTKRVVDAAETSRAAVFIWDDEIKDFGLRIAAGGTKSYVLSYRAGRGRNAPQHRITIGKHGSPWTPELARREARQLLGAIARAMIPRLPARPRHVPWRSPRCANSIWRKAPG